MKDPVNLCLIFLCFCFFSCSEKPVTKTEVQQHQEVTAGVTEKIDSAVPAKNKNQIISELNSTLLKHLKNGEYPKISKYIHPEKGVRFSMYAHVSDRDKHFSRAEFEEFVSSPVKFTWGETDGEGRKVVLSLQDYLRTWVFKKDFADSRLSVNTFQGSGNSLNNLEEKYPEADFTENYIPGTKEYSGMDWNTLRFVFEKYGEDYYLVAIINDQWTV